MTSVPSISSSVINPPFVASSARRAASKGPQPISVNAHQHAISKRCASCSIGRPRLISDFFMGAWWFESKSATTGNRYIARWFVNYRSSDQALPEGVGTVPVGTCCSLN